MLRQISFAAVFTFSFVASSNAQQTCGPQTLRAAALRGNLQQVNGCIAAGVDVDAVNTDGLTSLMLAAAKGHRDVVVALAARTTNINRATSADGVTALMFASHWGRTTTVQALVESGATVTQKDKGDRTAIDWAASYADDVSKEEAITTAKYLQSKGAALKQSDALGLFLNVGSRPNLAAMIKKEEAVK